MHSSLIESLFVLTVLYKKNVSDKEVIQLRDDAYPIDLNFCMVDALDYF